MEAGCIDYENIMGYTSRITLNIDMFVFIFMYFPC